MFNIFTEMPKVSWSTVPGPRSRGFDRKDLTAAEKIQQSLATQLARLGLQGAHAIINNDGKECGRIVADA